MSRIDDIFQEINFAKVLINSFPCGVLIVDGNNNVLAANNILENVLNVSEQAIGGKGSGEALGCIYALESPEGCGSSALCKNCELRNLVMASIARNRKHRARTQLQLIIDGQIRNLNLQISATPFKYQKEKFAIIAIKTITKSSSLSPHVAEAGFRGIVGCDGKMLDLFETIREVAQTDATVLIQGESGAGKELVALAIHKESRRARKHFVPVNCGALPEGLLESEFFGHVKGAFSGATQDRKGRFELADKGTIFLDEVSELSPAMQVKLLRVLQDGGFERVGSEKTSRVNVRVISATNKNLEEELEAGKFRQDLYYRLCVVPISVPPLRDRAGDIPLLTDHFLAVYGQDFSHQKPGISSEALSLMTDYSWPGNVRELQNVIQFALIKCQGSIIEPAHLPPAFGWSPPKPSLAHRYELKLNPADVAEALKRAEGNKQQAARILGVARSTLYRFLEKQKK